jgi:hypothetical protein
MWRQTLCAVSGIILAGAAVYGLSSANDRSSAASFDLRWLYPTSKADRLPIVQRPVKRDGMMMAFNVPSAQTTVATKGPTSMDAGRQTEQDRGGRSLAHEQSAHATPVKVRTVPVNPVRTVPVNEKQDTKDGKNKDKLPVGCEPAFSPVTTPAMAHVSSRCDA